ncbi:hypothetical protein [Salarchaeum sp. JOR-1]|nr:hypothetical protein [Salarchaeum sp. JOR-1]
MSPLEVRARRSGGLAGVCLETPLLSGIGGGRAFVLSSYWWPCPRSVRL